MAETLLSVGLDIGTTSTQMILSELTIENKASAFSVPEMQITERAILYKSPIHFTPLLQGEMIDGDGIRNIVLEEYRAVYVIVTIPLRITQHRERGNTASLCRKRDIC